jgi:amino acid adenylation domain-containing protein
MSVNTIAHLLAHRARTAPERRAFRFVSRLGGPDLDVDYRTVHAAAAALARRWRTEHPPGARIVIAVPPGRDFVVALFGCFLADLTAVPAYPPTRGESAARLTAIIRDCTPAGIVAGADMASALTPCLPPSGGPRVELWTAGASVPAEEDRGGAGVAVSPERIAVLQYTSGSTGRPKGVMITHANLVANLRCIERAFRHSPESRGVIWLPPYHDMGLIGGVLQPVFCGFPVTLMTPQHFLQDPGAWLARISAERATTSGGPNFAYDLCVQKVSPAQVAGMDLSAWSVAFSGSEAVRADTIERFVTTFAPAGFRRNAFFPCYGLAEATLIVTGVEAGSDPKSDEVSQVALNEGRAAPAAPDSADARRLISCGPACDGQTLRIVDPQTGEALADGRVGEIWTASDCVAAGYWNQPAASDATFRARIPGDARPFLRTGDLGYLRAGDLYVTGRLKEVVVIGGRKLHPEDIEETVRRECSELSRARVVVFAAADGERVMVIAELAPAAQGETERLGAKLGQAVAAQFGVRVAEVIFVRRSAVPTTLTGKIRRLEAAQRALDGTLPELARWRAEGQGAMPAAESVESETELEQLRRLAARILGRPIAAEESTTPLVGLGFDSIGLAEFAAAASTETGRAMPDDIGRRSLADLAALPRAEPAPAAPAVEAPSLAPLTEYQAGLWLAAAAGAPSDAYTLGRIFRVVGAATDATFRKAAEAVVARHDVLRCVFFERDGRLWQKTGELPSIDFHAVDANTLAVPPRAWLAAELSRPFELGRTGACRFRVVRLGPDEHLLGFAVHHIAADAAALHWLQEEFWIRCAEPNGSAKLPAPESFLAMAATAAADGDDPAATERLKDLTQWPDFPRRSGGSGSAPALACLSLDVDPELAAGLEAFCQARGYTAYVGWIATLAALLHRYTGQSDLAIGTIVSTRPMAHRRTVGYFGNPVVLRTSADGAQPFPSLLDAAGAAIAAARRHERVPFNRIVQALAPARAPDEPPFFSVLFNFLSDGPATTAGVLNPRTFEVGPLAVEPIEWTPQVPRLPFVLHCWETAAGTQLRCEFDRSRYDERTVHGVLANWLELIRHATQQPATPVAALRVLAPAERAALLRFNPPMNERPFDRTAFQRFEANCREQADRIAIRAGRATVTYGELGRRVERQAAALVAQGIGPGEIVAVAMDRGIDLVAAVWAVLKSGAAFMAIDPLQPAGRLQTIFRRAAPRLVLHTGDTPIVAAAGARGMALADLENRAPTPAPIAWRGGADDAAYVVFTSGSTGEPKGVVNTHRGLANLLDWMPRELGFTAADVFAQKTSVTFDVATWELLLPLIVGGTMVVIPREVVMDPESTAAALRANGITVTHFVPAMLRRLLATGGADNPVPTLRVLMSGGEKLDAALAAAAFRRFGARLELWNLYGPAEATIDSTCHRVGPDESAIPIGRPVPNTRAYVMDAALQLQPLGAPGELCLGGVQLARGYLHDPAQTAAAFVAAPELGETVYRTGDLARWTPDGEIEYLRRADDQVKIRGVRIELGEIEEALRRLPGIGAAAATLSEGGGEDPEVHAFVETTANVTATELRLQLRAALLDPMLPKRFWAVAALPLTPTGKIDRKQLPATPARALPEAAATVVELDETAQRMAALFAEILRQPQVPPDAHLFELGGHSLQLIQIAHRVRRDFGVAVTVQEILQHPSIQQLAALVAQRAGAEPETASAETQVVVTL